MTRDEIIQRIVEYIDLQLDGTVGEMCEEPCREVFFDLFAEAYDQGLITDKSLTAGALLNTLQDKWYGDADERNIDRADCLELLLMYWHAWQYAWEQYEKKHVAAGMSEDDRVEGMHPRRNARATVVMDVLADKPVADNITPGLLQNVTIRDSRGIL